MVPSPSLSTPQISQLSGRPSPSESPLIAPASDPETLKTTFARSSPSRPLRVIRPAEQR